MKDLQPLAVSPEDAAKMLGVGRTTIFALFKQGRLPKHKIGRRTLIRVTDLAALLGGPEQEPSTALSVENVETET